MSESLSSSIHSIRFALLAIACFGLTLALAYEGATVAIHGLQALVPLGMPRLLTPGLIDLGLGAMLLNLSWLTFRGARQQLAIARLIRAHNRDPRPNER
jgi:hypothetical protein